jgi:hypothetical protein
MKWLRTVRKENERDNTETNIWVISRYVTHFSLVDNGQSIYAVTMYYCYYV